MEYKILGKTNLKVSAIGFGSWAIGGEKWGPQKDSDSIAALNKAIDLGVNFIDTALAYGNGHSEEIIGKVVKARKLRDKIFIATKIPVASWPPSPITSSKEAFPKSKIITSIEQSLRNLNTDYIDIIQLHAWRERWTHDPEWFETLTEFKTKGKVRFLGVSVLDNAEDEALDLIEIRKIDTIQVVYNFLSQTPAINLFPKALKNNIGIIARVPLAYGALTGKFTKDTSFHPNDFRTNKYTKATLPKIIEQVEEFKEITGKNKKEDLVATALHFVLSHKAVSTTIPGIRNTKQAEENCRIFSKDKLLSDKTLKKLQKITLQKSH